MALFSFIGVEPDPRSSLIKLLSFVLFCSIIAVAYFGVWYIVLHQKELKTPPIVPSDTDIDFSPLRESSLRRNSPLSSVFLCMLIMGIVMIVMIIAAGAYRLHNLFITICVLLFGGIGLWKTGFTVEGLADEKGFVKFVRQNGFSYRKNNFWMSQKLFSVADVESDLKSFFPGRIVRAFFELTGHYDGEELYLASFNLTAHPLRFNISQGEVMLPGTYGLIVLPYRSYRNIDVSNEMIAFTAIQNFRLYVVIWDGVPKDRQGMILLFEMIRGMSEGNDDGRALEK